MEFRKDVQGLRAIAILLVLGYHFDLPGFQAGFVGVDIFFVISGYIIASIARSSIEASSFNMRSFLLKRVRRIHPALLSVVLSIVVAATLFDLPSDYTKLVRDATSTLIGRSNYAFVSDGGYFSRDARFNPLLHTWSLSVELQFYLAFALLCRVFWPKRSALRPAGIAFFAGLAVTSLVLCLRSNTAESQAPFYLLQYRFWEFAVGIAVSCFCQTRRSCNMLNCAGPVGIGLLGLSMVFIRDGDPYPSWRALMPVFAAACLLLSRESAPNRVMSTKPLVAIGSISYSLYLWHWPILVLFREDYGTALSPMVKAQAAFLALVAACISYRFVEKPIQNTKRQKTILTGMLVSTCGLFLWSEFVSANEGVPGRLPAYLDPAILAEYDRNPEERECLRGLQGEKRSPGDFCTIGTERDAPPTLMLWGDSFADRLQPDLSAIARSLDLRGIVATHSGCAPSIASLRDKYRFQPSQSCSAYADFVFQHLIATPSITTVVLSGIWQGYPADYLCDTFVTIARLLERRGGHLIIVTSVPAPAVDVPRALVKRERKAGKAIDNWSMPREAQLANYEHGQAAVATVRKMPNVSVVDPFASLCNQRSCLIVENGNVLYMDGFHLTITGAHRLAPDLQTALQHASRAGQLRLETSAAHVFD